MILTSIVRKLFDIRVTEENHNSYEIPKILSNPERTVVMKAEKIKLSGEKGKKISNQINGTYLSVCSQKVRILSGNITRIILCPSSGGKGIRLKTIKERFISTK